MNTRLENQRLREDVLEGTTSTYSKNLTSIRDLWRWPYLFLNPLQNVYNKYKTLAIYNRLFQSKMTCRATLWVTYLSLVKALQIRVMFYLIVSDILIVQLWGCFSLLIKRYVPYYFKNLSYSQLSWHASPWLVFSIESNLSVVYFQL